MAITNNVPFLGLCTTSSRSKQAVAVKLALSEPFDGEARNMHLFISDVSAPEEFHIKIGENNVAEADWLTDPHCFIH
jgi:hypothetical protein